MDVSSIALQGLQQADVQLQSAAVNIANFGESTPDGATLDVVDLSTAMVALMSAKVDFSANLKTLQTANEVQKSLLDLIA
jgi:flagellar basal body rod protein FlgC